MFYIFDIAFEMKPAFESLHIHPSEYVGLPFKTLNGLSKFMVYLLSLCPSESYSLYYNTYLNDCELKGRTPSNLDFVSSAFSPFFYLSKDPLYDNYCTRNRFSNMLFKSLKIPGLCTENEFEKANT